MKPLYESVKKEKKDKKEKTTADKMFEELGYKIYHKNSEQVKYADINNDTIEFHNSLKVCMKYGLSINMQELKAINKKCKELRVVIMCKYCEGNNDYDIHGSYFKLLPTFGFKNDRKYDSWIMKSIMDRKAGIMILTDNSNGVYFNINYCPMCGRKLGELNDR